MTDCVMCAEAEGVDTPLAYQDDLVSAFPARWQPTSNPGYTLIVTRRHIPNLYALDDHLLGPVMQRLRDIAHAVEIAYAASGTTIRQNNNPPGQDIDHLHFHVVPRHHGDNYWNAEPVAIDPATRQAQADTLRGTLAQLGANEGAALDGSSGLGTD